MVNGRHHLVVGLPESGKTTFIAALWHVVVSGEIPSSLRLHTLDGDRTHLNKIRDAWLACEPVPRTSQHAEEHVRMLLKDNTDQLTEVWFPDMSGESFQDQWEHRQWPSAYDEIVLQADSVLMFVHPDRIVEPLRISTVNAMASALPAAAPPVKAVPTRPTEWDAKQAPTQVQLVELLQFLQWRRPGYRWDVSVVASAWDLVSALGQSPDDWCAARLPMFEQFLRANNTSLAVRYWGVSAQGGALPLDAARLRAVERASDRIAVVKNHEHRISDITTILSDLGS